MQGRRDIGDITFQRACVRRFEDETVNAREPGEMLLRYPDKGLEWQRLLVDNGGSLVNFPWSET
jgi:hypothetical protein